MQEVLKLLFANNFRLLSKKESVDGVRITIVHNHSNQSKSFLLNINHPDFDSIYLEKVKWLSDELIKKLMK